MKQEDALCYRASTSLPSQSLLSAPRDLLKQSVSLASAGRCASALCPSKAHPSVSQAFSHRESRIVHRGVPCSGQVCSRRPPAPESEACGLPLIRLAACSAWCWAWGRGDSPELCGGSRRLEQGHKDIYCELIMTNPGRWEKQEANQSADQRSGQWRLRTGHSRAPWRFGCTVPVALYWVCEAAPLWKAPGALRAFARNLLMGTQAGLTTPGSRPQRVPPPRVMVALELDGDSGQGRPSCPHGAGVGPCLRVYPAGVWHGVKMDLAVCSLGQ